MSGNGTNGKRSSTKAGRPAAYDPERHPIMAEALAAQGYIDVEIAETIGIKEATFYRWKNKYEDFREALKVQKKKVDLDVKNALLKKALGGYDITKVRREVIYVQVKEGNALREMPGVKEIKETRTAAPDTTACIFWLKNRQPDDWREQMLKSLEEDVLEIVTKQPQKGKDDATEEKKKAS